jgi:hypothetical protein
VGAETLPSVPIGIGLSAACGFRVFVPLLVMSIASLAGHLPLSPGFEWIGSYSALLAFAVGTAGEIAGYYIPWVDHLLDVVASPAAVVAGIILMASSVVGVSPFLRLLLAIVAGGGTAAMLQSITGLARVSSTATTADPGNPVVSTIEAAGRLYFPFWLSRSRCCARQRSRYFYASPSGPGEPCSAASAPERAGRREYRTFLTNRWLLLWRIDVGLGYNPDNRVTVPLKI